MRTEPRAETMMHVVSLRILHALEGRTLTAQQIGEVLGDVAQATLYRHLSRLLESGLIEVVRERQSHGATERLFGLVEAASILRPEDVANAGPDAALGYFRSFVQMLLATFQRYVRGGSVRLDRDGVIFFSRAMYLSDDEWQQMRTDLRTIITAAQNNAPAPGRRRRTIAALSIPDPTDPSEDKP